MWWVSKRIGGKKVSIGVRIQPQPLKYCLVVKIGNKVTKYAVFNDVETAHKFMDILADFAFAELLGAERIKRFWGNNNDTDRRYSS